MTHIEKNGNHRSTGLILFLAGAATGAAAALLMAPRSGKETRDQIQVLAREVSEKAVKLPNAVREAYTRASIAARESFSDALKSA